MCLTRVVMELYSCMSRGGKDPMCFRGVIDSTRGDWFVWGGCIATAVGARGSAFTLCGCRVQHKMAWQRHGTPPPCC